MKKIVRLLCPLMAAIMMFGMSLTVFADADASGTRKITFTGTEMKSEFENDLFKNRHPGDTVELTIELSNTANKAADWYVNNSLESDLWAAYTSSDGVFEYQLTYEGRELYSDKALIDRKIQQSTEALNDWQYLGRFEPGETKIMTLTVHIDGETQGNAYQNSLSGLDIQYAATLDEPTTTTIVEEPTEDNTTTQSNGEKKLIKQTVQRGNRLIPRGDSVKTGDEFNIQLFSMLFAGSGILLLVLAVISFYKDNRKERE